MNSRVLRHLGKLCVLAIVASLPIVLAAQSASTGKYPSAFAENASKWDFFVGYSFFAPRDTEYPLQQNGSIIPMSYHVEKVGLDESLTYFFTRHVGLQFESGQNDYFYDTGSSLFSSSNSGVLTFEAGPVYRFPKGRFTPFLHALGGMSYVDGPSKEPYVWGPALTVGGGVDYQTRWLHGHFAIRILQADYMYLHANSLLPNLPVPQVWRDDENVNGIKLSAGFVLRSGSFTPPPPVTLACTVSPSSVFPGDPVTFTTSADNIGLKDSVIYSWNGAGTSGNGTTANVATTSLAAGTYTATATVKTGKKGREGEKPYRSASCTASFTVKAFDPPTISCSVSPATIQPGGVATITALGVSPQNRPLIYSYATSAGSVSGSGATAQYSSAGAPTGAVGITCNVADDKGRSATATTSLNILAPPPPPPLPHTQALCSIGFGNDPKRPTRVDNEAKACLDQVALNLKQQADARAVIIADSNTKEKETEAAEQKKALRNKRVTVENFAAQRAINTKDYLVTEQGIDPSRITVMVGSGDDQSTSNYLVPAGANFGQDVQGGLQVDEITVKPETRKPLPLRHPSSKR